MAERSVSIALEARVTGFVNGIGTARRSVAGFTSELEKSAKKRQALSDLGNTAGKVGFAAAAGLGAAVLASANFDQAMSNVQAATHETSGNMEELRAAALKAGADTVFSASEAADGIEQLAKAGVSTKDILNGGLNGALSLAAAGNVKVGDAAEYAATAMTQFGLDGNAVPHVADLLAAAAGKAQGEVSDFGMALKQGGLVANQTGLSIEETTGALGAFASAGLLGSDAGTSLKTMLQRLNAPVGSAAEMMDKLNLSAYDSQGKFIGLASFADQLRDRLKGMTDQQRNATMTTIFGSDAVRAASVVYDEGAKGITEWTNKVNDQGYAAETAATRLDNLKGDIEALKGSLETALIGTGDGAQGPLRSLTQGLTDVVNAYNKLPGPIKTAGAGFLGLTALTGGTVFALTKVVTGIATTRENLTTLGTKFEGVNKKAFAMKAGVGLAGGALMALASSTDEAGFGMSELESAAGAAMMGFAAGGPWGAAIAGGITAITQITDALSVGADEMQHFFDITAAGAGGDVDAQISALNDELERQQKIMDDSHGLDLGVTKLWSSDDAAKAADRADLIKAKIQELKDQREVDTVAAKANTDAAKGNTDATKGNARAVDGATDSYESAYTALTDYTDAQNDAAAAAVKSKRDQLALTQTMMDAREEAAKGAKTLNENTKAGRDNWNALLDVADQWNNTERKVQNADGAYKDMRQEFIHLAIAMGAPPKKARELADRFLDVPPKVAKARGAIDDFVRKTNDGLREGKRHVDNFSGNWNTSVQSGLDKAGHGVRNWVADVNRSLGNINDEPVDVTLSARADKVAAQLSKFSSFASGGPVFGAGTETSDSIPARLSNNEHVLTAKEVKAFGGHKKVMLWRKAALHKALPDPQDLPKFAAGGPVLSPNIKAAGLNSAVGKVESYFDHMTARLSAAVSAAANRAYLEMPTVGGMLGMAGNLSLEQLARGQQFAQAQDGKPYIWGGVGPGGYDCSGYQSAILNAALGRNPYSRVGTTGSSPWAGSGGGVGRYTIGYFKGDPGHMTGNIGGLGVESTGDHVRTGSAARSPLDGMFAGRFHYDRGGSLPPGTHLIHNGTGKPEMIRTDRQERALEQKLEQIRVEIRKQTGWLPARAARSGRAEQGSGGPTIVKIYDVDGQLMGSMRGEIDADRGYQGTLARQGVA